MKAGMFGAMKHSGFGLCEFILKIHEVTERIFRSVTS
jgi:hypothetical protein